MSSESSLSTTKKLLWVLLISFEFVIIALLLHSRFSAQALTINSARDCDANAIIRCGAATPQEVNTGFNQNGVAQAFSCFGISSQDVANLEDAAVEGQVTRSGNVLVGGKVIATDAITAGRQNMAGSTAIHCGGKTFFQRPPSVSFVSSPLAAFVVMNNDRFSFAILASCGNPVIATPVTPAKKSQPAPSPVPTPAPTPPPPPTQTQVQSQSVTVAAPTPPPTPTPASAPQKTLPSTGPGNVLALGGVSTIFGSLGHYLYQRRRLRG